MAPGPDSPAPTDGAAPAGGRAAGRLLRWRSRAGWLLGLLGWLGTAGGAAEPPGRSQFRTYGPEQGLTDPAISCLAQDAAGFLWIGTENGLLRYDGSRFQKWTMADGLPSSWVRRIFPLPDGSLWAVTTRGLVRFRDGRVDPARFGPKEVTGSPERTLVDLDAEGRLWVLRRNGVYRQTAFTAFDAVPGRPAGQSMALACGPSPGEVYIALDRGVWELRPGWKWAPAGRLDLPPDEAIEALVVDGAGRLWVAGVRRLWYRDRGGTAFRDATAWLPGTPFTESLIQRSANGQVWIPTNNGLLAVRGAEREVLDAAAGLPSRWARTAMVDREGSLWVVGPALYRRLGGDYVRGYTTDDGLPNDVVWVVYRDPAGTLWAGTNDGVARLGLREWEPLPGTAGLAPSSMQADAAGNLWIAFSNGPLMVLRRNQGAPAVQPMPSSAGLPDRPYALLWQGGRLWLGDPGRGVFTLDASSPRGPRIEPAYTPARAGVPRLIVVHLAADARGRIWAATNAGLLCRDESGWHRWTAADGLRHDYVSGVLPAGDGSCWIWYQEPLGLGRVAASGGRLQALAHYDSRSGLASDRVYAAVRDRRGAVWIGGDRGVDRLRAGKITHLGRSNGLVGEDCCANGMWADAGGDVWVGTSTGLARVRAAAEPPPPPPPACFLTGIRLDGQTLRPPLPARLALPPQESTVEFFFASPTFLDEMAMEFQVRLGGFEDAWRSTELRQARYPSLPGGRYRFEARARHPGGAFGPAASFAFDVETAWWRTWWFVGSAGLLAVALGALAMLLRVRAVARQRDRLEGLVAERTRALQIAYAELAEASQALKEASLTDPLTELRNRRYLSYVIETDVARVVRTYRDAAPDQPLPNQDLVFFLVDLDRFKQINDTHGHAAGDAVLRQTAVVLRRAARETDSIVRWGGEEFLVVARGASRAEAPALAERIRAQMARQVLRLESGTDVRWTCSLGFAALPFHWRHPEWLGWERTVAVADACLYAAKHAGRDAWVGVVAREGLNPADHDGRLPHDTLALEAEGLVEVLTSR